jgi:hypothetical protein
MLSEEQIKAYEAQHTDIAHVLGPRATPTAEPAWELVMRRPKKGEYRRYKTELASDRTKVDANENLVRALVIFPDAMTFDKLLDKYPAIVDSEPVHKALGQFVGIEAEQLGK